MINTDSNKEYETKVTEFDFKTKDFIKKNIINNVAAFIISQIYELDLLYNFEIETICGDTTETLGQIKKEDYNIDEIKKILREQYNLELKDYTVCKVQELES